MVSLAAGCGDGALPTDGGVAGDGGPRIDAYLPVDAASGVDAGDANVDAAVTGECPLPVAFDVGLTYARELHVSASATGGDGSAASPFGSIEDAARAATPGTRIVLAAGTLQGAGPLAPPEMLEPGSCGSTCGRSPPTIPAALPTSS